MRQGIHLSTADVSFTIGQGILLAIRSNIVVSLGTKGFSCLHSVHFLPPFSDSSDTLDIFVSIF